VSQTCCCYRRHTCAASACCASKAVHRKVCWLTCCVRKEGPPLAHRVALHNSVGARTYCWSDRYLWALLYRHQCCAAVRSTKSAALRAVYAVRRSTAVCCGELYCVVDARSGVNRLEMQSRFQPSDPGKKNETMLTSELPPASCSLQTSNWAPFSFFFVSNDLELRCS